MKSQTATMLVLLSVSIQAIVTVAAAQTSLDPNLIIEPFVSGLSRPAAMDWLASDDVLVIEREVGRVRRIIGGVLQPTPVYQLAGGGDDFLLGIAINTESPAKVFLFVEDQTGAVGNRVLALDWNPISSQLENPTTIVEIEPSGSAANADDGGYLLLGPPDSPSAPPTVGDGQLLYVVSGYLQKGGELRNDPAGVPPDNAGVIMRVLQDGSPAPGNPFAPYCSVTTSNICDEDGDCPNGETCVTDVGLYYAYGLRNSFGIALDPVTGYLWDEENGEDEHDEINRVVPGMNSGWTAVMGPMPEPAVTLFEMPGGASVYRDPEFTWFAPTGPTGVAFPFGTSFGAAYNDKFLFADFNLPSQIYALPLDATRSGLDLSDRYAETQAELDQYRIVTDIDAHGVATEFGPDGSLYVIEHFSGEIFKITGPGQPEVPSVPASGLFLLVVGLLLVPIVTRRFE